MRSLLPDDRTPRKRASRAGTWLDLVERSALQRLSKYCVNLFDLEEESVVAGVRGDDDERLGIREHFNQLFLEFQWVEPIRRDPRNGDRYCHRAECCRDASSISTDDAMIHCLT